jgi:hypothetical protein
MHSLAFSMFACSYVLREGYKNSIRDRLIWKDEPQGWQRTFVINQQAEAARRVNDSGNLRAQAGSCKNQRQGSHTEPA